MYAHTLPLNWIEWFLLVCLFWDLVVGSWRFPYSLLWLRPTSCQVKLDKFGLRALACWESSTSIVFIKKTFIGKRFGIFKDGLEKRFCLPGSSPPLKKLGSFLFCFGWLFVQVIHEPNMVSYDSDMKKKKKSLISVLQNYWAVLLFYWIISMHSDANIQLSTVNKQFPKSSASLKGSHRAWKKLILFSDQIFPKKKSSWGVHGGLPSLKLELSTLIGVFLITNFCPKTAIS